MKDNLLLKLDIQFFAGAIATYDAKKVSVIIGGVMITGFAEKTFVEAEKEEETVKPHVSAQGDVGVAINNHSLGKIKIKLNQTSPSIPYMNKLARNSTMVPAWVISDNDVKEKCGGSQAMVTKVPKVEFGDEITEREFEVQVFDWTQE